MPFDNSTIYESKSVDEFHFSVPIDLDTLLDDLQEESSQTESYDVDLSLSEQQSETYQYNLSYQETSNEETISSPNKSESKDEESIDTPIPLEDILNNDYHMSQDVYRKLFRAQIHMA